MVVDYLAMSSVNFGRVGPAFELIDRIDPAGALSFAYFAKGGYHSGLRCRFGWNGNLMLQTASYPPLFFFFGGNNREPTWLSHQPSHGQTFNNPKCQHRPAIFWPGYTGGGSVARVAPPK